MFDRGYIAPYMVTDTDKMVAELDNPYILITDKKISNTQEILPILEQIVQSGRKLLIIAEDRGRGSYNSRTQQVKRYIYLCCC